MLIYCYCTKLFLNEQNVPCLPCKKSYCSHYMGMGLYLYITRAHTAITNNKYLSHNIKTIQVKHTENSLVH